jgi:hypothetical protein
MTLQRLAPGNKLAALTRKWDTAMALIVEEASMVGAPLCNALTYRSTCGRQRTHDVPPGTYSHLEGVPSLYRRAFGRIPIVIFLGDFLQLPPTGMTSLIEDANAKLPDGSYVHTEPLSPEVQHACNLFQRIPNIYELQGTKRFVEGDPLIQFLNRMRAKVPAGQRRFPPDIWAAFEDTFARDTEAHLDPRHTDPQFLDGYGMAMYWEPLVRWMSPRARRDARALGKPLVFLQAADEVNTVTDKETFARMLNVSNMHKTGHMHGVLPAHEGMRVRLTQKYNATAGIVQEQKGTIVCFVWHEEDAVRYATVGAGELFRPRRLPGGIWLQLDNYTGSPIHADVEEDLAGDDAGQLAKGLFYLPVMQDSFSWQSSRTHMVTRYGFTLTMPTT